MNVETRVPQKGIPCSFCDIPGQWQCLAASKL